MPIIGSGWVSLTPHISSGVVGIAAPPDAVGGIGPFPSEAVAVIIENRVPGCFLGVQNIGDNATGTLGPASGIWTIPPMHRGIVPVNPYGAIGVVANVYPYLNALFPADNSVTEFSWNCPYVVIDDPQTFRNEPLFPPGSLMPVTMQAIVGNNDIEFQCLPRTVVTGGGNKTLQIGDTVFGSGQAYIMQIDLVTLDTAPASQDMQVTYWFGKNANKYYTGNNANQWNPAIHSSLSLRLPGALGIELNPFVGTFTSNILARAWVGVLP